MTQRRSDSILQQLIIASAIILPCTIIILIIDQLPFITHQLDRGQIIGRDAFNFWLAGKLAFEGHVTDIYDNVAFMAAVQGTLGEEAGLHVFPYPPPALLFVAAFGWIPYWLTLLLWSLTGLIAFTLAIISRGSNRSLIILGLIAPLSLCNIVLGQNGLFVAALFIGGLRLAKSKPIIAGMLIGCLIFKPTLAILLPLALIIERCWLAILSAAITIIVLSILPAIIWGPNIWQSYLQQAVPFQQQLLEHGTGLFQIMKLTSFMSMVLLGFDSSTAYFMQAVFAIIALGFIATYFLRRQQKERLNGLDITIISTATLIITPYSHFYDMTLLAGGLLLICKNCNMNPNTLIMRSRVFVALWILPIIGVLLNAIGLPIAPIILLICLGLLCYAPFQQTSLSHSEDAA